MYSITFLTKSVIFIMLSVLPFIDIMILQIYLYIRVKMFFLLWTLSNAWSSHGTCQRLDRRDNLWLKSGIWLALTISSYFSQGAKGCTPSPREIGWDKIEIKLDWIFSQGAVSCTPPPGAATGWKRWGRWVRRTVLVLPGFGNMSKLKSA